MVFTDEGAQENVFICVLQFELSLDSVFLLIFKFYFVRLLTYKLRSECRKNRNKQVFVNNFLRLALS